MNVYIDESGIFRNPGNKSNTASCVAGLVMPNCQRPEVVKRFRQLKYKWGYGDNEVKGKSLDESKIAEVIGLLSHYDVILDVAIMDLGLTSDQEITSFKLKAADGITVSLTPQHKSHVVKQAQELRDKVINMSNSLFVQAAMTNVVITHIVQNSITYYSRRIPEELKTFHWVVDAKDKQITDYEKTWSLVIYPYIYSQSLKQPLYYVEGGDYTYFDRHKNSPERDRELVKRHPEFGKNEIDTLKVKRILGNGIKFENSKTNFGLQLVDILANATQRALNRKLDISGWSEIGRLMISEVPNPVRFLYFDINQVGDPATKTIKSPYSFAIKEFGKKAKSMWP